MVQHVVAPIARLAPGPAPRLATTPIATTLANCELDESAYADMAAIVRALGAELGVPVLVCLEGGYALGALASSTVANPRGPFRRAGASRGARETGGILPEAARPVLAGSRRLRS
jgi:hypothetical protein